MTLFGAFERVKISLDPVDLEGLSKVWTALTLPFRISAAYTVSVVQIEDRSPGRFPRLVGEPPPAGPRVYALPFRSPQIRDLRLRRAGDPPDVERPFPYARPGDTLILLGRNLAGEETRLLLGPVDVTAALAVRLADRLEAPVPDDPLLQPGAHAVRVDQGLRLGDPAVPHAGFSSNLAVFMLVPRVDTVVLDTGVAPPAVQIDGAQLFGQGLECLALVGDAVVRSSAYTTATPAQIRFDLPAGLAPGSYAVRVRVNGAETIDRQTVTVPP
jgi:hypothetical protein